MVVGTYTVFEASESATLDINDTERKRVGVSCTHCKLLCTTPTLAYTLETCLEHEAWSDWRCRYISVRPLACETRSPCQD